MEIVVSLIMIAAGAIMRYAVTAKGNGFNVHTTGMVLIVVGAIGAVLSIAYWASRNRPSRRTTVVGGPAAMADDERVVVREREIR